MFRLQKNIKNLKRTNNFVSLHSLQQNQRTVCKTFNNLRVLPPSAFYSTKRIELPKINDEQLVTSIFTNYNRLDSFIGDKAYNYYAVRALKLKFPEAIRTDFMNITSRIISREFLIEVAGVCELDKMMSHYTKNNHHLGEMMEAYCSAMLFNGMEKEMKKFTSDIIDYYFEKNKEIAKKVKENIEKEMKMKKNDTSIVVKETNKEEKLVEMKNGTNKVVKETHKEEKQKGGKKNDDDKDNKTTNKAVKETNKEEKQKGLKMNKNDDKNIKENSKNSKKKKKETNNEPTKEKKKEILSIKGQ
ncbi:hypothetical protein RclHR1_06490007 [Rhizophagus clarus]|nr:hypothetical protein RclHR1_06490007 [Rhizophagus clarus]